MLSRFSHVRLSVTPWTVALQASLSMGFSRQEYWNGLPCPLPGDLPDPGIELLYHMSPALAGGFLSTSATWKAQVPPYLALGHLAFSFHLESEKKTAIPVLVIIQRFLEDQRRSIDMFCDL